MSELTAAMLAALMSGRASMPTARALHRRGLIVAIPSYCRPHRGGQIVLTAAGRRIVEDANGERG